MGDLDTPECSWKKMVIAKSNNEWISTIKSDTLKYLGSKMNTSNFSLGDEPEICMIKKEDEEEKSICNIKKEREEESAEQMQMNSDSGEHTTVFIQELNPLYIETHRRRRSKGSVPKCESPEERAVRLAKMSAYAAQRLANESPEQRAIRLRRMSEYAARRLAKETSEQRSKRLARMSEYAAKRLAKETPEQRQARLSRMSAYAARRHAMKKNNHGNIQDIDNLIPTNSQYDPLSDTVPDQS